MCGGLYNSLNFSEHNLLNLKIGQTWITVAKSHVHTKLSFYADPKNVTYLSSLNCCSVIKEEKRNPGNNLCHEHDLVFWTGNITLWG